MFSGGFLEGARRYNIFNNFYLDMHQPTQQFSSNCVAMETISEIFPLSEEKMDWKG